MEPELVLERENSMADLDIDELATKLASALSGGTSGAVTIAEIKKDLSQAQKELAAVQEMVYKQHEPVIIWSRNFMDSYRRVLLAVVTSGIITAIGLVIQLYYMLSKSK